MERRGLLDGPSGARSCMSDEQAVFLISPSHNTMLGVLKVARKELVILDGPAWPRMVGEQQG
jgi:hypothetical protein